MTNEEAVRITCEVGRKIEESMSEAEAYLRAWRAMPNGGHDAEFMRLLRMQEPSLARGLVSEALPGNQPTDGPDSPPKGEKP